MPADWLIDLAVTLRGVRPHRSLPHVVGHRIALVHGLRPMTVVMAGSYLWLSRLFWLHTPTLFGQAMALVLLIASLPPLLRIALSLLVPTARLEPGMVELARMPLLTLRRRRFPAQAFRLGLRPWRWSRRYGRGASRRTESAHGWAFVLEDPRMLPVVLELRWQGPDPEDLADAEQAEARAEALSHTLGLPRHAAGSATSGDAADQPRDRCSARSMRRRA